LRGQRLIAEDEDAVRAERRADVGGEPVGQWLGEVDAADLGADASREWPQVEMVVPHGRLRDASADGATAAAGDQSVARPLLIVEPSKPVGTEGRAAVENRTISVAAGVVGPVDPGNDRGRPDNTSSPAGRQHGQGPGPQLDPRA